MTTMAYEDLATGVVAGIESGVYRIRVESTRPRVSSAEMLFLGLEVQNGPLAGKHTEVTLVLPKEGNRGMAFHYANKMKGFGDMSAVYAAMGVANPDGSNGKAALEILGKALLDRIVEAEIVLREDGEYAGTNELVLTKPVDGVAGGAPAGTPVPVAVAAAPVAVAPPVAAVAPVPTAPASAPVAVAAPVAPTPSVPDAGEPGPAIPAALGEDVVF